MGDCLNHIALHLAEDLSPPYAGRAALYKELKVFAKVALEPGETKTVSLELDADAFSDYVPHLGRLAAESGAFTVMAGTSSQDICPRQQVRFVSGDDVRLPLTAYDSFKDFLADDRYAPYAKQLLEILHIDESHMFYEMLHGGNLNQMLELLSVMGIDADTGKRMMRCLVERKDLTKV